MDPLGHVDFYPQGGEHQPGCTEICFLGCTDNDLFDLAGCSHDRAIDYFIESINGQHPFYGQRCDTWTAFMDGHCQDEPVEIMGEPLTDRLANKLKNCASTRTYINDDDCKYFSFSFFEGKYFLRVNTKSPFAFDVRQ
jgi:hypothetical protein